MRSNPQFVENVARAIVEGVAFARNPTNKKIVMQSLAKNLRLDKPDILKKKLSRVDGLPASRVPTCRVASVLKLLAQHGLNPKAAQLKTEDIADMSLCKSLTKAASWRRNKVQAVPDVQTVQIVPLPAAPWSYLLSKS
jgi:hypothetical protein